MSLEQHLPRPRRSLVSALLYEKKLPDIYPKSRQKGMVCLLTREKGLHRSTRHYLLFLYRLPPKTYISSFPTPKGSLARTILDFSIISTPIKKNKLLLSKR